ncbi:hypothetical protein ARMGADRAFT_1084864 [Armillaria gallica]|uniref:Uncharacterized protein n=1 Tax=Armillaria gallica TaxID=47427 RepID=A0A2H3DBH5_ARMGA|nr:hypothetical protein ARMGADRAFT_1084864 [Armillaria gallica]
MDIMFHEFLGLAPIKLFSEWSTNPKIAWMAELLYEHIDNLELYPGLQAEDYMPLGPWQELDLWWVHNDKGNPGRHDSAGAWRSLCAERVCVVAANLTSWGIQDCACNPDIGTFGVELPKLLFHHLPWHCSRNGIYGLFPFFTPAAVKENLTNLKLDLLNYNLEQPKPKPIPIVINTISAIRYVFSDYNIYK